MRWRPDEGQQARGQHGADPAREHVRGDRVFTLVREAAGEHLKARVGEDQQHGQEQCPVKVLAAGADDHQRADKAPHHQRPAQRPHLLLERPGGQQRDHERCHQHDGSELAHRDVLEAEKRQQAAGQQEQATHQLKARVLRVKKPPPAPFPHHGRGHDRLEGVAEPQREQHRDRGAHVLGGGVQCGKAGHGEQRKADAGQRVGGARAHRMRSASSSQTGVSWPGSQGRVPRSVWLSSGLWKSLPREAARPNSSAVCA